MTYYAWDGIRVLKTEDGAGALRQRQVHGYAPTPSVGDMVLIESAAGDPYAPIPDQVGTNWKLLDSAAAVANSYQYDAFGVGRSASESFSNPYRFAGKPLDPDPTLYHFLARQYVAGVGRFLLPDSFPSAAAVRYAYVNSSPLRYVDPRGLWSVGVLGFSGEHERMTEEVTQAKFAALRPALKWYQFLRRRQWDGCEEWVTDTLVDANRGQDLGKWPRSDHEKHYIQDRAWQPEDAERMYQKYLGQERTEFAARLGDDPPDCQKALQALGRLLHSWEDFFAHACRRRMFCGRTNERAWVLWSAERPVTATPDANTKVRPSMWLGEHQYVEPTKKWPEEYAARLQAAKDYDRETFGPMFDQWWRKCRCWCLDGQEWE